MKIVDFSIDKNSFVPAYYQLAKHLEDGIQKGELLPGDKIESETYYSEQLGISRMTVRRAFEILSKKGLIFSERGRGTFVARKDLNDIIFKISEFFYNMKEQGLVPENRLLEIKVIPAPKKVKQRLQLEKERVLYLKILKLANGKPIVYEHKYVIYNKDEVSPDEELKNLTFAELVEKMGEFIPIKGSVTIMATTINSEESKILQVKEGSPAFCIEHTLFSIGEKPVAWGIYIYRGDEYKFTSEFSY